MHRFDEYCRRAGADAPGSDPEQEPGHTFGGCPRRRLRARRYTWAGLGTPVRFEVRIAERAGLACRSSRSTPGSRRSTVAEPPEQAANPVGSKGRSGSRSTSRTGVTAASRTTASAACSATCRFMRIRRHPLFQAPDAAACARTIRVSMTTKIRPVISTTPDSCRGRRRVDVRHGGHWAWFLTANVAEKTWRNRPSASTVSAVVRDAGAAVRGRKRRRSRTNRADATAATWPKFVTPSAVRYASIVPSFGVNWCRRRRSTACSRCFPRRRPGSTPRRRPPGVVQVSAGFVTVNVCVTVGRRQWRSVEVSHRRNQFPNAGGGRVLCGVADGDGVGCRCFPRSRPERWGVRPERPSARQPGGSPARGFPVPFGRSPASARALCVRLLVRQQRYARTPSRINPAVRPIMISIKPTPRSRLCARLVIVLITAESRW